jgi:regulator of protease activity HflC (stomatin/prohibitin superfamily)
MIRKIFPLLALALFLPLLEGCLGCTHIEMGYVGIEMDNCSNGAQPTLVGVGYHSTGACTNIIEYPTNVQTVTWTKNPSEGAPSNEEITFTNADQMQISVDISLAYQLLPEKVPAFYAKFRADKLETFTYGFMHNLAREKFDEAAGKYKIENIMGDNSAFVKEVRAALQHDLDPYGVVIAQFGFIGAPRPPQSVIDSINAKANAVQKSLQVELELKQSEAEARKSVAKAEGEAQAIKITADAQAYANQKLASSLSPVLVQYKQIEKWNGILPTVSGGSTPFVNIGGK